MPALSMRRSKPWKRRAFPSPRSSSCTPTIGLMRLISGEAEAAALMEPLVSRALAAGCRKLADLRWRGGIVASDDVDAETAAKITRALNRAVAWLRENDDRSRREVLRDLAPDLRPAGMMPELVGVQDYRPTEFRQKVEWMVE